MSECEHDWEYEMRGGHEYKWRTCGLCDLEQRRVWRDVHRRVRIPESFDCPKCGKANATISSGSTIEDDRATLYIHHPDGGVCLIWNNEAAAFINTWPDANEESV